MKRILFVILALGLLVFGAPSASGHNEHYNSSTEGIVSVTCFPSHYNRDDPIIFPEQAGASHLHQFTGNTTTNASSTYNQMVQSNTTCKFKGDTAGYWFPALVRPDGNNVVPNNHWFYYSTNTGWDRPLTLPPAGFKMVAGQPFNSPANKAQWMCQSGGIRTYTPDIQNCPLSSSLDSIQIQIRFPSCWDGINKWLPGSTHVAWPITSNGGANRTCPSTHPIRIFELEAFAVWYDFQLGHLNFRSNGYRLSSDKVGDSAGVTLHADFWNTWNQTEYERILGSCLIDHIDVPESGELPNTAGSPQDPSCLQIEGPATQQPPLEDEPTPSPSPSPSPIPVVTVGVETTEIRCTDGSVPSVISSSPLRVSC